LTLAVYRASGAFPAEERYGLTSQLRRAASSIAANIAEGCGRVGDSELSRFLQIAFASASELEYHLLLARDLKYLKDTDFESLNAGTQEVKRMLYSFIKTIRRGRGKSLSG
jgi:four helix bundle protein